MKHQQQLRPYQHIAIDYLLARPRCGLWLPMGMGKTVSVLTAIDRLLLTGELDGAVLVIAPLRVANNTWPSEIREWSHLRHLTFSVVTGTETTRRAALCCDVNIYITNWENVPWLVKYLRGSWPFKMVVADESGQLRGFRLRQGTARAKALAQHAYGPIKRFVELNGTPAPNGLSGLWGQLWFCDRGERLGRTYDSFRQRWFQKGFDGYSMQPLPNAQREIQKKLAGICLSLDPKDYFDLREPIVTDVYVDLPPAARQLYDDMEKRMFMEIDGKPIEAFNAAARTNKCLQVAAGAAYIDPDADESTRSKNKEWCEIHTVKLDALRGIIEEANGMPVLVAYIFKSDLTRLLRAFPQGKYLDSNPRTITDWNKGKIPVLFAHPASAGHGLNLADGSNIIVFFSRDWNLESYLQIIERIGPVRQRQAGYQRNVFIYHILARNTLDEDVAERHRTKKSIQDILLAALKQGRKTDE